MEITSESDYIQAEATQLQINLLTYLARLVQYMFLQDTTWRRLNSVQSTIFSRMLENITDCSFLSLRINELILVTLKIEYRLSRCKRAYLRYCIWNKSQKGLPLGTKNTQNHENQRLGLIESLHMQHYILRCCIRPPPPPPPPPLTLPQRRLKR